MDRRTSLSLIAASIAAAGTGSLEAAQTTTGGVKLTVLYGHPPKPAEFEKYYVGVHMPLVYAMKGVRRLEAAKCLPQADGSPPAFYRIFEAWFDSPEQMAAAFASPEGMKVRADAANFAEGTTITRLTSKLD